MNHPTSPAAAPPLDFEWRVHPFAESRPKAILSIVAPLAMSALIHWWLGSWLWTTLGLALLISAEFPFFLRSDCRFDSQGASLRRAGATVGKKWDQIKSYYPDKNGVLLSPFARPFWLENFRGLYLPFGRHRQEVLHYLGSKLGPPDSPRPAIKEKTDISGYREVDR
jgi:hypothetical protein